jgi:hypothetical protein
LKRTARETAQKIRWVQLALLLALAASAVLVHGYHPTAEDGAIYLPAIKKDLNPALYPFGAEFFMSHARLTLFDELVAASIRLFHLPFDVAVLLWHLGCIFVLLFACWRIARRCFTEARAPWGSVALLGSLLTVPVAGTALLIMDQYLTTRDLSTAAIMVVIANAMERRLGRAAIWTAFTAAIHPLMAVFGAAFVALLASAQRWPALLGLTGNHGELPSAGLCAGNGRATGLGTALLLPLGLSLTPPSAAYRAALETRSYFFLLRWAWYEWLGIFAPLALLWWIGLYGRRHGLRQLELLSRALIFFTVFFFSVALVITVPDQFAGLALLQPMRALHLVFILLFVLLGGILAQCCLLDHAWRWVLLLAPLCLVMFLVNRAEFPASPHLEFPGRAPSNPWLKAFAWVRANTPPQAIFALDPRHMELPGEDQHGFRAAAERSMLADAVKDSGVVTMFPALAETWQTQVNALAGWRNFGLSDFHRLRQIYGVTWVVLQQPGLAGMDCPYRNEATAVCRVP